MENGWEQAQSHLVEIQAGVSRAAQRNRFPTRGKQRVSPAVNLKTEPESARSQG